MSIYERLVQLKLDAINGRVKYPRGGICENAYCHEFSESQCEHWPDYSGDKIFPIPHPELDPERAYIVSRRFKNRFDLSTEYGRNRMRYLDFLIHRAELLGV